RRSGGNKKLARPSHSTKKYTPTGVYFLVIPRISFVQTRGRRGTIERMEVRVEDYALAVGESAAEKRPKTRPKRTSVRKRAPRKPAAERTEPAKNPSTRRTTARTTRTARPRARKKAATAAPQTSRPPAPDEELRIIDVIGASAISVPAQMPT